MNIDAGHGALGVRWPHSHLGMICFRAIVVRNYASERLIARRRRQRNNRNQIENQKLHKCSNVPISTMPALFIRRES
jgi:hypothetical protein